MKVRVKEGKVGYIYDVYRTEGNEFELIPITRSLDGSISSVDEQFTPSWMEKIEPDVKVKKKPGPKPKVIKEENED